MRRTNPRLEPVIETRRLKLRPVREADRDDIVAGIGDPLVSRMLARVPYPYTISDAGNFLRACRADSGSGRGFSLMVEHAGRVVGGIGIHDMPHLRELGYWLRRDSWGRGFATEASGAILNFAFDVLHLPLIRSGYFVENAGSGRVQRKLGFMPIGRSRRSSLARDTEVTHIDTVLTPARFRQAVR
jgi:RimJ/RimL family protein N-acetyltransferase